MVSEASLQTYSAIFNSKSADRYGIIFVVKLVGLAILKFIPSYFFIFSCWVAIDPLTWHAVFGFKLRLMHACSWMWPH